MTIAAQLQQLLGLEWPAVAIGFTANPPAGLPHVTSAGPSSCTYWKRAAEGESFYTESEDHYNCPIGAYTHGVDLQAPQKEELQNVVGTMIHLGYLRAEEVPNIPRRSERFRIAAYAPLEKASFAPDIVLVRGNARQVMLLDEAAQAAGVGSTTALMGRPTCAALPAALDSQHGVASLGCIGNRVYTELEDDELYYALPGKHVAAVVEKLAVIVNANRELEKYHRARLS
jgi:uncharacterized protein (DUF169 family)